MDLTIKNGGYNGEICGNILGSSRTSWDRHRWVKTRCRALDERIAGRDSWGARHAVWVKIIDHHTWPAFCIIFTHSPSHGASFSPGFQHGSRMFRISHVLASLIGTCFSKSILTRNFGVQFFVKASRLSPTSWQIPGGLAAAQNRRELEVASVWEAGNDRCEI